MIYFFSTPCGSVIATEVNHALTTEEAQKLSWLFGEATLLSGQKVDGRFVGPRREMITPWSTNAVEITQNMNLCGISRIEEFFPSAGEDFDPMLQRLYEGLDQEIFTISLQPAPIQHITDLEAYNEAEGLALSPEEIAYLHQVEEQLGRKLTDSEVFGFAQINSEHCRHKIFGGTFIIDGEEKPSSLFNLIKKTTREHPHRILSAYKDNVAFAEGPVVEQFAPRRADTSDFFEVKPIESVISIKAETHNFPTTVEPFNGASTGTGGEIRDRMGGGVGSWPIAGTAVYMTAPPRPTAMQPRPWLYQTPRQILIKASNGASDFGNKFGQPLIAGSVLTFEHEENGEQYGYDKVIMLAGGVGYGTKRDCLKGTPQKGNKIVVVGGDNYRIGLGGGSVSSVETGRYASGIELNAVQRANPEMQKRAYNLIRALCEGEENPVVSIHDHGSAGHVNCLSELVEECGGAVDMSQLPIGDTTLSAKEIIANESQERMGLLIDERHIEEVRRIAERERAPLYVVGETTGDAHFSFQQADGVRPFDLDVAQMFGHSPKTVMRDSHVERSYRNIGSLADEALTSVDTLYTLLSRVLRLEAVACKDWLTNKVDRSVTGKVARQQCVGALQLPLADCGVVALDYKGRAGIATAIGHAPQAGLADAAAGSVLSVAEALTNIVFAPLRDGLDGVSLSANWMWPCRAQQGEDARLYDAVEALSDFCCALGINVPTGKDSLSMTQKYPDGKKVIAPGTVIVSAGGEVNDVRRVVTPQVKPVSDSALYIVDFSSDEPRLGGSAFAQSLGYVGSDVPTVKDSDYFRRAFGAVQEAIQKDLVLAGHDVSAGGLVTCLLEMCFANEAGGLRLKADAESLTPRRLFAENPAVVLQVADDDRDAFLSLLSKAGVSAREIARPTSERTLRLEGIGSLDIDRCRDAWRETSYELDRSQSLNGCAEARRDNYAKQPLRWNLPAFSEDITRSTQKAPVAAIIREKGTNGEREMAYALHAAGFRVKDVMMTDLVSGRETLEEVQIIVFCGGFSNSDVLGSAKGWAGAFLFNPKAKAALERFYAREDTLSLGVCNGCQLMVELGLIKNEQLTINNDGDAWVKMQHNDSRKFESAFLSVAIPKNESVMFGDMAGAELGIWVAHGEGKFRFTEPEDRCNIVLKYLYDAYPANPNGSDYAAAGICSSDGRHLAMMPHLERAFLPWQCADYPADHLADAATPWLHAFQNARRWCEMH